MKKLLILLAIWFIPFASQAQVITPVVKSIVTPTVGSLEGQQYSAEYQVVYNSFVDKPSSVVAGYQDLLVDSMVAIGVWGTGDLFYVKANNNQGNSSKNWLGPGTYDLIVTTATHTAYEGFTGVSPGQLDTQYAPGTDGVNYTQNSASVIFYSRTDNALTQVDVGALDVNYTQILMDALNARFSGTINDLTGNVYIANTNTQGWYGVVREDVNTKAVYKNKTRTEQVVVSTGIPNVNLYFLARNFTSETNSTKQLSMGYVGGAMTEGQMNRFFDNWETYMMNINKDVVAKHIYIQIGQSNADGQGDIAALVATKYAGSHNNIYIWNSTAFNNLNFTTNNNQYPPAVRDNDHGFETFAVDLQEAGGHDVYIIKLGIGSTELADNAGVDWNVNSTAELYDSIQSMITRAVAVIGDFPYEYKAVMFHQGESDMLVEAYADDYEQNLKDFIDGLRGFLKEPGIPFYWIRPHISMPIGSWPYRTEVRAAGEAAVDARDNAFMISTDTYDLEIDNIHLSSTGQRALGVYLSTLFNSMFY